MLCGDRETFVCTLKFLLLANVLASRATTGFRPLTRVSSGVNLVLLIFFGTRVTRRNSCFVPFVLNARARGQRVPCTIIVRHINAM